MERDLVCGEWVMSWVVGDLDKHEEIEERGSLSNGRHDSLWEFISGAPFTCHYHRMCGWILYECVCVCVCVCIQ